MQIPNQPSMRLDGRRALVTGAGRGLGFAAAAALAAAGAEVVLLARSPEEVDAAAQALCQAGGRASGVALDVVDVDTTAAWLEQTPAFDILVNNAGTNRPDAFLDTRAADYDAVFNINVRAAYFVAQGVARRLVSEQRGGSIINMSSQMGHVGASKRTVYCATKHAVEGMTKAMAAELGAYGIRVNTLCPTFIETTMTKPFFADETFLSNVMGKLKMGRLGVPEDIMGAIVFLASDASALMTGSALMLDSGWTTTS
ncbi:SDR family NAD(P)-dependent oxidoreductase [Enterobacter cloacae complex sp. 2024EL-00215]|uniref:SDR family NAD(P)-dependent oxidoreductase n=1 Tax=unclassified Enterobacter cloacae complex TaxID=2757714 RepID=UPI0037530249